MQLLYALGKPKCILVVANGVVVVDNVVIVAVILQYVSNFASHDRHTNQERERERQRESYREFHWAKSDYWVNTMKVL